MEYSLQHLVQTPARNACTSSLQTGETSGLKGEVLPYLLRSDWAITCVVFLCFILLSYVSRNGKRYVSQHIKSLFLHRRRANLFDQATGSINHYTFTLVVIACILSGLCIYDFFADTNAELFCRASHWFILGTYIGTSLLYVIFKWGLYSFVNWIFFDKERNSSWIRTYFDLLSGTSLLLFPLVLFIIYLNLDFQLSKSLTLSILGFAKTLLFYKCIRNFFNHFHGILHLILYFCALELIPLILLWKGITYINNILILNF